MASDVVRSFVDVIQQALRSPCLFVCRQRFIVIVIRAQSHARGSSWRQLTFFWHNHIEGFFHVRAD